MAYSRNRVRKGFRGFDMAGSHHIPKWMPRYWLAETLGYPPGVPMIPCGTDGNIYVNPTIRALKEFRAEQKDMSKLEMIDIGLKALRYWRSKCKSQPNVDKATSKRRSAVGKAKA